MEYVKTAAPVIVQVFGPEDASYLLHLTGKLIGMQYYDEVAAALDATRGGPKEFADFLRILFASQDDVAEINQSEGQFEFRQQGWKLMADVGDYHPACTSVLTGLFEGLAAGCGRNIPVHLQPNRSATAPFIWSIG